jgi:surface polysaccharide O-acyltransferase-like enzyme
MFKCEEGVAMKNGRHTGIELFRIIMMFGICMIHACRQGHYARADAFTAILCASVVGFVFMSGYFGVSFKLSKVVRLYSLCVLYCCLVPIIGWNFKDGYIKAVLDAWGATWRFWFLHAYIILMAISGLLNKSLNVCSNKEVVYNALPILFVVFIWGWLSCFSSLSLIIPLPAGMTGASFLTMLGIYVASRLLRFYEIEKKVSVQKLLVGLFITLGIYILTGKKCEPYMCPLAFMLVAILFYLFYRIKLRGVIAKLVLFVSPSMFGIYILNAMLFLPGMDCKVYGLLNAVRDPLISSGFDWYLACLIAAIVAFSLSLLVDITRRMLLSMLSSVNTKLDQSLNSFYDKIVERIVIFLS